MSAAGDSFYKPATVTKTVKITVKKVNPIIAVPKTITVTAGKKQVVTRGKALVLLKAKGAITYTKKSGNKLITIAKKTGTVVVKKGLKAGKTYKMKIGVRAAGNSAYAPKSLSKFLVIRVVKA